MVVPRWVYHFCLYGILGFVVEVLFTSVGNFLCLLWSNLFDRTAKKKHKLDYTLQGTTYAWMFFVYGNITWFENVYLAMAHWHWLARGATWSVSFLICEYIAGFVLKLILGKCPWDYTGTKYHVHGLVKWVYAPLWMSFGLMLELFYENALMPMLDCLDAGPRYP